VLNFDASTVKYVLQNTGNDCHLWLSHSFRVQQIRFWPGLRSGLCWGKLTALPLTHSWFKGDLLLRRRGGQGKGGKREGKGAGEEGKGDGGEGFTPPPLRKFLDLPLTGAQKSLQKAASKVVSKRVLNWRICTGRILPGN